MHLLDRMPSMAAPQTLMGLRCANDSGALRTPIDHDLGWVCGQESLACATLKLDLTISQARGHRRSIAGAKDFPNSLRKCRALSTGRLGLANQSLHNHAIGSIEQKRIVVPEVGGEHMRFFVERVHMRSNVVHERPT